MIPSRDSRLYRAGIIISCFSRLIISEYDYEFQYVQIVWERPTVGTGNVCRVQSACLRRTVTAAMNHYQRTIISLYGNAQDNESAQIVTFWSEWQKVVFIVIIVYYLFPNQLHCFGQMTMAAFRNAYNVSN